ncbi:18788_t:CDS:2, partial [Dentiscutata erythropus]
STNSESGIGYESTLNDELYRVHDNITFMSTNSGSGICYESSLNDKFHIEFTTTFM